MSTDSGEISVLVLLDLRAAFDTVDHRIVMVGKLGRTFQSSPSLLQAHIEGQRYLVSIGCYETDKMATTCAVPLGSVLRHLLFNLCRLPLAHILQNNKHRLP